MNSTSEDRNNGDDKGSRDNPQPSPNRPHQEKAEDMKLWGVFIFALIGATATTFAAGQLRRTVDWVYTQLTRAQSLRKGATGGSFRSGFQEEAGKRYSRRMQEEYEEEMERVERIRRMQSVFNRERNKFKRSYESWTENDPGAYHQHFQREDWYWKTDKSYRDQRTSFRETPRGSANYPLSHHYSVLGLDRVRTKPYTEDEIKVLATVYVKYSTSVRSIRKVTAFRTKAKEFHPDQNQDNKELAEAKFKEVMTSYEAIKVERKNK